MRPSATGKYLKGLMAWKRLDSTDINIHQITGAKLKSTYYSTYQTLDINEIQTCSRLKWALTRLLKIMYGVRGFFGGFIPSAAPRRGV